MDTNEQRWDLRKTFRSLLFSEGWYKRKTLYCDINPEPTLYGAEIPPSVLPTPVTARKPAKRNVHKDEVSDFSTFEKHERRVTFYKMGRSALDIPEVSETIITVD